MPLKPFTYPLPETRFVHAGKFVYKFKIRYGNFNSAPDLNLAESAAKESEEVIRVVLGNLDDLHPFSTDHFIVFPYLSKWERVSKMKFKHENVHLVPYPYICTLYLELNSFQQNMPCGKEVNRGTDELVKRRNEMSESAAVEKAVKRRRVEVGAETSCLQSLMDKTGADQMSKAEHGYEKNSSKASEEKPVESALEQRAAASQAEGPVQLQQQMDQTGKTGNMNSGGRSLSRLWRRIIISPLHHLFGRKN